MTDKNYLVVENNIVTNIVVWNGDVNTWQPPVNATMLVQETTPAKTWRYTETVGEVEIAGHFEVTGGWELIEDVGFGGIGFTWDGSVLTTSEPQPPIPEVQLIDAPSGTV